VKKVTKTSKVLLIALDKIPTFAALVSK